MTEKPPTEPQIIGFATPAEWRAWLSANHTRQEGIWMRLANKGSDRPSISYAEALDGALCYGWIDGQLKKTEADSRLQKFTPRRARSPWSKRNREHVARLEAAGLMREPGRRAVAAAKADGRWYLAYDNPGQSEVPADFLEALAKDPQALAFFKSLNKANTYGIAYRLQTAKLPATRRRRFEQLLGMMSRSEKLY